MNFFYGNRSLKETITWPSSYLSEQTDDEILTLEKKDLILFNKVMLLLLKIILNKFF